MAEAALDSANKRLAINLRRMISERGFENTEAFAKAAGCGVATIYAILRASTSARISTLDKVAAVLEVDVSVLLTRPTIVAERNP